MRHPLVAALTLLSVISPAFAQVSPTPPAASPAPSVALEPAPALRVVPFVNNVDKPTALVDDGSGRLFVLEQPGRIRLITNGALQREPFLDISGEVKYGGECGLLGIAFHPDFAKNGRFFLNYDTVKNGKLQTIIAEFHADPQGTSADPASEKEILSYDQPFPNHKGGQLAFGPDGMLYIAAGDGGSGRDPLQNGQNLNTYLAKIMRIDINSKQPYGIPKDNPLVGKPNTKEEIYAWGLRNPWRFSFDKKTGKLWAGDVGQDKWEEVDIIENGKNYGWSAKEGTHDFKPERAVGPLTDPIKDYGHNADGGHCIIGGYVYRGTQFPALQGVYIYGDYVDRKIWGLKCEGNGKPVTMDALLTTVPFAMSSFGEDKDGELYILNYTDGQILRVGQ